MTGSAAWQQALAEADWPHRSASRAVQAGGLQWQVQLMGQGPPLWLLHGTGAASHSWRALAPALAQRHTVVVPDLPGHGFSGRLPAAQQHLPGMAAALGALAQALGLPAPAAVLGHSAGAALAARAMLDGALPAVPLLGLNAALVPLSGLGGVLMTGLAGLLARQPLVPRLFARRAGDLAAVRRLVATTGSRLDDTGLALYARLLRQPAHVAGALAMMADWDLASLWADLPRLPGPLHLLVGEADATVPPAQARQVAAHCPATVCHALPGLGHLAHEEAPDLVLALLARLLPGAGAA